MVHLESLVQRARRSADGEAYAAFAKGEGYRLGTGVRLSAGQAPDIFVEIVLDPFANRPGVDPDRLSDEAALLGWLRRRGYSLTCDDAGVVTAERVVARTDASGEERTISTLLKSPQPWSKSLPPS